MTKKRKMEEKKIYKCTKCGKEHNHYHYLFMGGRSYDECEECCKTCKRFEENLKKEQLINKNGKK